MISITIRCDFRSSDCRGGKSCYWSTADSSETYTRRYWRGSVEWDIITCWCEIGMAQIEHALIWALPTENGGKVWYKRIKGACSAFFAELELASAFRHLAAHRATWSSSLGVRLGINIQKWEGWFFDMREIFFTEKILIAHSPNERVIIEGKSCLHKQQGSRQAFGSRSEEEQASAGQALLLVLRLLTSRLFTSFFAFVVNGSTCDGYSAVFQARLHTHWASITMWEGESATGCW